MNCVNCSYARRRLPQSERDKQAAAVGCKWLGAIKNNKTKAPIECLNCGHRWQALPKGVARGGGCPECRERNRSKIGRKRFGLSQQTWEDRFAAEDLDLLSEVTQANAEVDARCRTCGYKWRVKPSNVYTHHGCPRCAETGFDPTKAGFLYLLKGPEGIAKVGITNSLDIGPTPRLAVFRKRGYTPIATWKSESGASVRQIEKAVLRWWRNDLGLPPALSEGEGHTETVALSEVSIDEIIDFIEREIGVLGIDAKCSRHPTPSE